MTERDRHDDGRSNDAWAAAMEDEQDPTLEDALDGLQAAEGYCESAGMDDVAREIAALYQRVGNQAPAEDR